MISMQKATHARVTIKDIAREGGVSTATVSRVLNGYPYMKAETRQRVERAIEALNYSPNAMARCLRQGNVRMLALIVSDIANPFYPQLCRGIQDQARKYNYHVIICNTDLKSSRELRYLKELEELRISGIIFGSALMDAKEGILSVLRKGIPAILVNRRIYDASVDYVVADNKLGGKLATEHLFSLGHKRIAHIGGPDNSSNSLERLQGYLEALALQGIESNPEYIIKTDFTAQSAYRAVHELLSLKARPTAIFVVNDNMAITAIAAIRSSGLRVPEDIAVVGFDDSEMAANDLIQLTTVSHRICEMGRTAVDIIMHKIENPEDKGCRQIVFRPELIIRRSCGAKPVAS